jgi:hypothetical protein
MWKPNSTLGLEECVSSASDIQIGFRHVTQHEVAVQEIDQRFVDKADLAISSRRPAASAYA